MTDWRHHLLEVIGAPITPGNLTTLGLWADSEGVPGHAHNPLGAVHPWPGSHLERADGPRWYPSFEAGILATAQALDAPAMRPVRDALRQDDGAGSLYYLIHHSPWALPGVQGGHYPERLWAFLRGRGEAPGPQPRPGNPTPPGAVSLAIPGGPSPTPKPTPPTGAFWPAPAWRYLAETLGITWTDKARTLHGIAGRPHH